jgi:hypothetical protein
VDGSPVHASIRDASDFVHDNGAANNHRVDGGAVHPTQSLSGHKPGFIEVTGHKPIIKT